MMNSFQRSAAAADRECVSSRVIDASPARVFRAFSDPVRLSRWWGPAGFTNSFSQFDLRPGGAWRFVMHAPDGTDYPMEHRFVEVVEPERVTFVHLLTQTSDHRFEMTISFTAEGTKTVVGWCQRFDTAAEWQRVASFVVEATEQNLDRLEAEVARVVE